MEHLKQKVSVLIDHLQMRSRMLLFTFLRSLYPWRATSPWSQNGKLTRRIRLHRARKRGWPSSQADHYFFSGAAFIRESDFNGPLFLCCVRSLQRAALPPGLRRPPLELLRDTLGRHFVMSLCVARCQNGIKKLLIIVFRKWPPWRMLWDIY